MAETIRQVVSREAIERGRQYWNEVHEAYTIREDRFRQNVLAPYARLGVTAWQGPDDVKDGFAIVKRPTETIGDYADETTAWISLVVGKDRAATTRLLEGVLSKLRTAGVESVHFGADPQHFFPGIGSEMDSSLRASLKRSGFDIESRVVDLTRTLSDYETPEKVASTRSTWDVDLHRGTDRESDLHALLSGTFSARWDYEAANIARLPGGLDSYWLAYSDGDPVGFVRASTPDATVQGPNRTLADRFGESVLGVGPLGIAPEYRGRGWGLAMIDTLLTHYRDAGLGRAIIDWTDLPGYYEQLGFEMFESYEYAQRSLQ